MLPRSVTPLGVSVLALLFERPMHPYEMFQLLTNRRKDRVVKVRPGSLYHTVERLERDGLVLASGTDRQGNRPERTIYEITSAGRAAMRQWVSDTVAAPTPEYPRFTLGLAELHNLESVEALALLEERIAKLAGELSALDDLAEFAREVPELFTIPFSYTRAMAQAEVDWLRAFVDRVRSGEIPWVTEEHLESTRLAHQKGNA
ncbi:PadR family transcriptional regulator [Rhodococcus hoagii]|jgi:DNA-binding PadR family transcriptional regulator|uniref:PadR family transcriptional regulator n=2 Tax=Rhodococcus hoagii TaxID=43767 RepID=A0AAE3B9J9_RHOHA|nr:PadR family transcriptional regulator [Prescottella equi]GBF14267.1 transcriptional regulator PadR-like family protein [Rhodococcus sp. Br-6]MBM4524386.1 PadR family transcriptional regulator [Prescottella equi]MBM4535502.1 PadR family transcriptional regulator [Prescottella equi]MBM4539433.1 PadR family transcriptional regulator [Prescottella equi]MBM4650191.1 PadR family transcriptional regulator [Prescottella equi]